MSKEGGVVVLFEDAAIKQKILVVWERVFSASNRVILQANSFGFLGMVLIPVPNIHQMLIVLQGLTSIIDVLLKSCESEEVGAAYDEIRLLLNAKKQLTTMEYVAVALKANNREDYDSALEELEAQAPF